MNEKMVEDAMTLILHAGNARSIVIEAMNMYVEDQDYKQAAQKIVEAQEEIGKAHQIQTDLLFEEMQGKELDRIGILMIHAQDHFMNAMTVCDLAKLMIDMNQAKG